MDVELLHLLALEYGRVTGKERCDLIRGKDVSLHTRRTLGNGKLFWVQGGIPVFAAELQKPAEALLYVFNVLF